MKIQKKEFFLILCLIMSNHISLIFSGDIDFYRSKTGKIKEQQDFDQPGKDSNNRQNLVIKNIEEKKLPKETLKVESNYDANSKPLDLLSKDISLDPNILSNFEHTSSEEKISKEQLVRDCLEKLPKNSQPSDMAQALQMIKDGAFVYDSIKQGRFYDAVVHNFSIAKNIGLSLVPVQEKTLWRNAFNTSDLDFWNIIKNDKVLAKKASHHDIPFTLESLQSVENAMYFRSTYARIYSKEALPKFIKAYQESIVQLQWHLFAQSIIQEGRAFSSGMISVKDPSFALFKFLDGYAELVSPKYKLHNSISLHSLTTTKAYTRKSSHYEGAKRFDFDCGIDIQDSKNQPLSILPGNKSHILFGLRSNDMCFVKWENYGVTLNPLEGDMSLIPHIKGYFDKKDKHDDPVLERREKILADVTQEFKKLYGDKKITGKDKENIDAYGISYMIKMLDPKSQETFKNYLIKDKKYSKDSLDLRKGNEIILSDLLKS